MVTNHYPLYNNPSFLLISGVDEMGLDGALREMVLRALSTQINPRNIDISKFQKEKENVHCFAYIADHISPNYVLWEPPSYYHSRLGSITKWNSQLPTPLKGIIILHSIKHFKYFNHNAPLNSEDLYYSVVGIVKYYEIITRLKKLYGNTRICFLTNYNYKSYIAALISLKYRSETLLIIDGVERNRLKNWDKASIFVEGLNYEDTSDVILRRIKSVFDIDIS